MKEELKDLNEKLKQSKRGGAREGAGVKKGTVFDKTIEKQETRKVIRDFVSERMEGLLEALYDNAVGLNFLEVDEDGNEKRYKKAPDSASAKILLEHAIGKPKESVEHSGSLSMSLLDTIRKAKENNK